MSKLGSISTPMASKITKHLSDDSRAGLTPHAYHYVNRI